MYNWQFHGVRYQDRLRNVLFLIKLYFEIIILKNISLTRFFFFSFHSQNLFMSIIYVWEWFFISYSTYDKILSPHFFKNIKLYVMVKLSTLLIICLHFY